MQFKDLYLKDVNRELNPAVSADDLTDETVNTEIGEYVFTDEIINGVAAVVGGIKNAGASHNGIWVSGYFGSGKSHFMKFICQKCGVLSKRLTMQDKPGFPVIATTLCTSVIILFSFFKNLDREILFIHLRSLFLLIDPFFSWKIL